MIQAMPPADERVGRRQDFSIRDLVFGEGLWYAPGDVESGTVDNWFENVTLNRNDFAQENHFPTPVTPINIHGNPGAA
jgi:hypothetical protein